MYSKAIRLILFATMLLLTINGGFWFFSSGNYCQDMLSKATRKRSNSDLKDELAELHQIIIRMKRNEFVVDKLLSGFNRQNLAKNLPVIYCITPTYNRPTQKADLTRLCQTLQHVENFHWIVVEDSEMKTDLVSRFLERCGVTYTHLSVRTSPHFRRKGARSPRDSFPRGMEQRNKGLEWVRQNVHPERMKGVVYFADDDNTYDVEIFRKMRQTKTVSIWPVGFTGGMLWEGPVCKNNTIVDFRVVYKPNREIPIDMAGFAVNAELVVKNPRLKFDLSTAEVGRSESTFLSLVAKRNSVETLGDLCNKVLVWHTRTSPAKLHHEGKLTKSFPDLEY